MGRDSALRATRLAYDEVAEDYARLVPDLALETPLDRAVLAAFVELAAGDGTTLEVGSGTGRLTAHLADAGLRVVGLDLSLGMTRVARAARPDLPLAVAHAGALPLRDAAVTGLVAWYSLINLPTAALADVAAEFARVLRPGAPVLVGFQCGDGERVERSTSYGRDVPLTYYRHRTSDVADALEAAGLVLHATVERRPALAFESTSQACLLAHAPRRSAG